MNEHIALAIKALEQMKSPGITQSSIDYLRTMDNTIRVQIDRIIELQRQLTKAEEGMREREKDGARRR